MFAELWGGLRAGSLYLWLCDPCCSVLGESPDEHITFARLAAAGCAECGWSMPWSSNAHATKSQTLALYKSLRCSTLLHKKWANKNTYTAFDPIPLSGQSHQMLVFSVFFSPRLLPPLEPYFSSTLPNLLQFSSSLPRFLGWRCETQVLKRKPGLQGQGGGH